MAQPEEERGEKLRLLIDREIEEVIKLLDDEGSIVLTRREYAYARALLRSAFAKGVIRAGDNPKLLYEIRKLGYTIE
jgi:hypothetical protein